MSLVHAPTTVEPRRRDSGDRERAGRADDRIGVVSWLVTGGAGYIGAHVVQRLRADGIPVVALDDLSTGRRQRLPGDVPLIEGSVLDGDLVRRALREHDVDGVVHLAAKKQVGESMQRPLYYYRENVGGCESLLQAMLDADVRRLVFSSSAAVYGAAPGGLITEDSPTVPVNPYGGTKLICEQMIRDVGRAHGLAWLSLRYFNVAGAGDPALGDLGAANLIPMVFQALAERRPPVIFGDDYDTPDGTCVRDFIHVADLADAHVAAVAALTEPSTSASLIGETTGSASGSTTEAAAGDGPRTGTYNVGRGEGASVRQVITTVESVLGRELNAEVTDRRPGDPPMVVADTRAIANDLDWHAQHDLRDMIDSAWQAWEFSGLDR
jgi:UDP-glucose 4-epimerase